MNKTLRIINILPMIVLLFVSTCGHSKGTKREKAILERYSVEKKVKYTDLLVKQDQYTTSGGVYHKKFFKYLIAIAGDIIENKKLVIEKESIGFYYDKRSGAVEKLYLGLDIDMGKSYTGTYGEVAVRILRNHLRDVLDTMNSCRTVFYEKEIVGMVVGWKWVRGGIDENLSIWIKENDVIRFEENRITFDELIHLSSVTNTKGLIIMLPL